MTEAQTIDEYQKKIKLIAAKEEPYDVFISFKATDEHGRPTEDSLLAQEIYYYLTKNLGLKVFFSNITLKDKAGQEYEPIIYAALSSATVMVLVGTKPDYVNATWVKNEWSRYIRMIAAARQKNKSKYIVTALKTMRPEELPSALASYQAVNLAELGAKEKLCSNIDSLIGDLRVSAEKKAGGSFAADDMLAAEAANLCKLGFQQLAVRDFAKADEYFQKAMEKKSDAALAHWGMLLVACDACNDEELAAKDLAIEEDPRYKLAIEYATAEERMRFERIGSLRAAARKREAEEYCARGFEALAAGDFEKADVLFTQANEIDDTMSLAYWGMLQACVEVRNDEELGQSEYLACSGDLFEDALRYASPAEKERYLAVLEKNKAAVAVEAQACLERADEFFDSEDIEDHKTAASNIILAIKMTDGDIPARYYWAWLRQFMGAVDDEMMAEIAYPVKDDIFYKRAVERADAHEAQRYERIATRCQTLYNIRINSKYHYMQLLPDSSKLAYAYGRALTEDETFISNIGCEVLVSCVGRNILNTECALDEYMMKYITGIIPDPYVGEAEDAEMFGRYKYLKNEKVSVYLESTSIIYKIRGALMEKLGMSSEEAQTVTRQVPCYIGHDIPFNTALALLTEINSSEGNRAFIHAEPLDGIINDYEYDRPNDNTAVAVYITKCTLLNGDIIKFLRKNYDIDKRAAKEAAAGLATTFDYKRIPYCLAQNAPLREARKLEEDVCQNLNRAVVEYRWK